MTSTHGKNALFIKKQNEQALKQLLFRKGPLSRSEIAAELNLSSPAITNIVGEFIRAGVLRELPDNEDVSYGIGRRPVKVDFVSEAQLTLGISLGRDLTHWSICGLRGEVIRQGILDVMPENYGEMLDILRAFLDLLKKEEGEVWEKLMGICLVMPGYVDAQAGMQKNRGGHEKIDWQDKPLAADVSAITGLPVCCENNVRARAYAVQLFRPQLVESLPSYAFCYLNWGIACPVFMTHAGGSQISSEGEIGHMIMDPYGIALPPKNNVPAKKSAWHSIMRNYHGVPGSLEMYSSTYALLEYCSRAMALGQAPILSSLCPDPEALTPELLWHAQELGDPVVCSNVNRAMSYIGIALANTVNFLRPGMIFLCGRPFDNPDNTRTVQDSFNRYVFHSNQKEPEFRVLPSEEYGSAVGACAVGIRRFFLEL